MQFTEQQISAVARVLSDRAAEDCEVDKEDNWKTYSENYIADAQAALTKLPAAAPQVVADEPVASNIAAIVKSQLFDHQLGAYLKGDAIDLLPCEINDLVSAAYLAAAPVQPVAVPDGRGFTAYENEQNRVITVLQAKLIKMQTLEFQSRQRAEQECKRADELAKRFPLAAPAAQGDAKDSALLDFLQDRVVDVIYLDDGQIIDVRGLDVRAAIAAKAVTP